jgi:predicted RNase H-like HicB family nuclease
MKQIGNSGHKENFDGKLRIKPHCNLWPKDVSYRHEAIMKNIKYIVYKEGKYFVSQCLNVDVSSFGETVDEAVQNLKEALELYFEDNRIEKEKFYINIDEVMIGETVVNA